MSLCFTAGTLYVPADNLYVSTSPLVLCVYNEKVADGCLVNDTEDRLPPSLSCSEDLSMSANRNGDVAVLSFLYQPTNFLGLHMLYIYTCTSVLKSATLRTPDRSG